LTDPANIGADAEPGARGSPAEVFLVFLGLGLTSFGGPIAHIGYFRRTLVERRRWLTEAAFVDRLALCQFLPGPASSQLGYCIGLLRAGPLGGAAAWAGFTLPSALIMLAFAYLQGGLGGGPAVAAAMHGLKLVAVAVVAQALVGMVRTLTPDARRASIAVGSALIVLAAPPAIGQLAAIVAAGVAGWVLCPGEAEPPLEVRTQGRWVIASAVGLVLFAALFLPGGAVLAQTPWLRLFHGLYRSGALVFGGGHVVLPLLRDQVVAGGWMTDDRFLAGYGAAQALPGPLFSVAAYIGADAIVGGGAPGAAVALIAIFLPGLLLVSTVLPHWARLRTFGPAGAVMRGVNAGVVGILATAFYNPVWTSAVLSAADLGVAITAFLMLTAWRLPPLLVVIFSVVASLLTQVAWPGGWMALRW
jgi:chromate transporter